MMASIDQRSTDVVTILPGNTSDARNNGSNITEIVRALANSELHDPPASGLVDTCAAVSAVVASLSDLPNNPPSIYIDIEGVNLSRHGSVSILQLYVLPTDSTYLIDVHTLGKDAFLTKAPDGQNLKSILESATIPKAFYDIRNDSDALYSHFGIQVAGVADIQLMELATRSYSRKFVKGLGKCIEEDLIMKTRERRNWKLTKELGINLFAPERGGSYEVFNVRPLSEEVKAYCMQDVQLLPRLWQHYSSRLTPKWRTKVEDATKERVKLSQSATYNAKGPNKALGPWK